MDRGRPLARLLIAGVLLLLTAADRPALPIRESLWLVPESLPDSLTQQPTEYLAWPKNEAGRRSVAIGRAAFGAPLLLGGQAARAGLSCATCHRSGRGNPHFHFPGLSGAPGTADVTSSLMSKARGDGNFNPKPIPDLSGDPRLLKHSRGKADRLKTFIHGLIVEEFDGHEPPAEVLQGVVAYVQALSPAACPKPRREAITLDATLAETEKAIRAADGASDPQTARLLIGAARSRLGQIDQRFTLAGLERPRRALRESDHRLRLAQEAHGRVQADLLSAWLSALPDLGRRLKRYESRSLFNPAVLRRKLSPGSVATSG